MQHPERAITDTEISVPSREDCLRFLERIDMPPHIRRHSLLVAEVALFLGRLLNRDGSSLNLQVVQAGALLHDVGKMKSLATGEDHAVLGARMLDGAVHPAVAKVVGEHILLHASQIDGPLTESLLVNYSDKRVRHDEIVSVEKRYHDLIARYAKSENHRRLLLEKLELYRKLERKIFSHLQIEPLGREIMGLSIDRIEGGASECHENEKTCRSTAGGGEIG